MLLSAIHMITLSCGGFKWKARYIGACCGILYCPCQITASILCFSWTAKPYGRFCSLNTAPDTWDGSSWDVSGTSYRDSYHLLLSFAVVHLLLGICQCCIFPLPCCCVPKHSDTYEAEMAEK